MAQIDIPAWWGVILATLVSIAGAIRYFVTRPKLTVNATLYKSDDIKYPNRITRINLKITTTHTTTIECVELVAYSDFSWKTRLLGFRVVSSGDIYTHTLPKRLEAADVLHGWIDAISLYDHAKSCAGKFRLDVYDTLHGRCPTKVKLVVPKDFSKSAEPVADPAYRVIVGHVSQNQIKEIANGFNNAFGIKELKCSFVTNQSTAQFEFLSSAATPESVIAGVVTKHGAEVIKVETR